MAARQTRDESPEQKIQDCRKIEELLKPDWMENLNEELENLIDPDKLLKIENLDDLIDERKAHDYLAAILKNKRLELQGKRSIRDRKMEPARLEEEIKQKKEEKSSLETEKKALEEEIEFYKKK